RAVPVFTGGDTVNIELRTEARDEGFEQTVCLFQLVAELGAACVRIFSEHGQRALVVAGGVQLVIDVLVFEHAVEIGYLSDDANGADNGERRRHDAVGDTGHHVTAAGRDLVDGHGQMHAVVAHALELRCGQTVAMHDAAGGFQPQQHLVTGFCNLQHGGNFIPQGVHRSRPDITVEVE